MEKRVKGLSPVLCDAYFACPNCGSEVKAGAPSTCRVSVDDWGIPADKFCSKCGQPIEWSEEDLDKGYDFYYGF